MAMCNTNAFRVRLSRALTAMRDGADQSDQSIAVDFSNLKPAEKAKVMQEHHEKVGPHLKLAIQQRVTTSRKTQTLQRAMAKGHMKDEIDLREKYGNKPEQLEAIMQNAMSFTCPIRRVQLWADPDFSTEWGFSQEDISEQTLILDTNDTARPTKKQKTEKAPPIAGDERALKGSDLTKLKEVLDKIAEDVNKYRASVEEANSETFTEFIPVRVTAKMKENRTEVLGKIAQIEEMIESGRSMYTGTELRKMLSDIKKTTKKEHGYVKCRVATVKSDMAD